MDKLENMDHDKFLEAISGLDDDTLMDEWTQLGERVQRDRERLLAFSKEHQRRIRMEQILRTLGNVTDEDVALFQSIAADGIKSQEAVMTNEETNNG